MKKTGRSLRWMMTVWITVYSALGLLALTAAVLVARRAYVREFQDAELAASARQLMELFLHEDSSRQPGLRFRALPILGPGGFVALRSAKGDVLSARGVRQEELLPLVAGAVDEGPLLTVFDTLGAERAKGLAGIDEEMRVITVPFREGENLYFLQMAGPQTSELVPLGVILGLVALGVVCIFLAARIAAGRIVTRFLHPLSSLADSARSISPSNMGWRFRVRPDDAEMSRVKEELNGALQRMEEGYRIQAQFASHVAHELKTPIAALVTDAQVSLLERKAGPEQTRAFMRRVEEEMKHLNELVESFLIMARVGAKEGRNELVHVDDVVRRAVNRSSPRAESAEVRLTASFASPVSGDPFVRGDASLLQAMVENLIRNAINHSTPGKMVSVDTESDRDSIRVLVRDQGPGIPEEFRHAVFERGVGTRGLMGTGLPLVRSVAQLHHGSVTLEENEDGGCSFVVTLPAAAREAGDRVPV
jgi:signal transduction histidine kinase